MPQIIKGFSGLLTNTQVDLIVLSVLLFGAFAMMALMRLSEKPKGSPQALAELSAR